jgi:hypothetical protein
MLGRCKARIVCGWQREKLFRADTRNPPASVFAAIGLTLIAQSAPFAPSRNSPLLAKMMPSVANISIEAMGQRVKLEQSGGN